MCFKMFFKGEWWNADTEAVISQALQTGGGPNVSDAYTMNGLPGPLYNCSTKGTTLFGISFSLLKNVFDKDVIMSYIFAKIF